MTQVVSNTPPISPHLTAQDIPQRQKQHIADLMSCYIQRTKTSKHLAQTYRPVMTDSRYATSFRLATKEVNYPIIGQRSTGSKLWDVDDNEYIDLTMGY
ncbi:MAG TPA: hypothetical protein V6D20_05210, partial [Candidatus Obscuribacterales bacterium]